MGLYDNYGDCQIKAGACLYDNYQIGDKAELWDGVYVAYEGVVVIKDGIFVAKFPQLFDKWGGMINLRDVLDPANPVAQGLGELTEKPLRKKGGG